MVKERKKRIVHQIAYCLDCDKKWEDYINSKARKQAYKHAKNTGHRTRGETGTSFHYN